MNWSSVTSTYLGSIGFSLPSVPISAGVLFNLPGQYSYTTASSPTTGPHIGALTVQNIVIPTPTSVLSSAYVTTSGESIAMFFHNSGGSGLPAQYLLSFPTVYKNGTSVGDLSSLVPWVDAWALPLFFLFLIPLLSTDVITMSAPSGWIFMSDQSGVQAV